MEQSKIIDTLETYQETLRKYIQRFSRVQYNIPDVHPAAVISGTRATARCARSWR